MRGSKERLIKVATCVLVCAVSSAPGAAKEKGQAQADRIPNEYVVEFKKEAHVQAFNLSAFGIEKMYRLRTKRPLAQVRFPKNTIHVTSLIQSLKKDPNVLRVEPNYLYHIGASMEPQDPEYVAGGLWGLKNEGQKDARGQEGKAGVDIAVRSVWEQGYTGSHDVVVAVIDTGVSWTHPDLVENLYTNAGEIPGNGVDDDKNGFVDDVHGWNFVDNTALSGDDNDHGSHCAGTIGARGGNDVGVVGVNWKVRIMPLKFLTASGSGSLSGALEAIDYATKMHVDVMSNSWGGGGASEIMEASIRAASDAGILFVAAAGNESNDNDQNPSYPASYDVENVVSVAAIDNRGALASFSNFGKTRVHVAAPGVSILSSVKDGSYKAFSGTSMATPHVAGIAALLKSIHPEWTFAEIKKRLIETSEPERALRGKSVSKGRVSVANALSGFVPPSNEPDPSLWEEQEYALESEHPYKNDTLLEEKVTLPGAKHIRLHFKKVDTEVGYDGISIRDANGTEMERVTGKYEDYWSEYVDGDTLSLLFESDYSVGAWGFEVDKVGVIWDHTAPELH